MTTPRIVLTWDRGTVLVEGSLPQELRKLSFLKFDERVGKYRALAIYYPRILAAARALGVEVEDRVWSLHCAEVRAAAEAKLRSYQAEALAAWSKAKRGVVVMAARPLYPHLPTWSIMSLAAFVAIVLGPVSIDDVPHVVNFEVLFFLVGMFSIVALAEKSGLLEALAYAFISPFKTRRSIYVASSLLFGLTAAFAVNDTVALMPDFV